MKRRAPVVALFVFLATDVSARWARADEVTDKKACLQAYETGQRLLDEHKLASARRALMTCTSESCPTVLRKDCIGWLHDLETRQPTAVFRIVDEADRDILSARISVDGTVVTSSLGMAIPVDPGPHTIQAEAEGRIPIEQQVVVSEGEKNRSFIFHLQPNAVTVRDDPRPTTIPPLSIVLGGLGLAALGAFAYFGVTGDRAYGDLENGCGKSRSCSDDEVGAVRTKLLAADVALGLGLVALGGAALLLFTQTRPRTTSTR